ncbi:3-isopropylmalate dehydratase small subunit [Candidatus Poriferisocius sp.]|uniref:3-isopropylmalate dehydratase small subunit n=1 Tax=Candidatus Poriferisocius sp. TaxID=3101276 RepID=UPI003B01598B
MKPVRTITAPGLPLDRSDVDTDQIIPSDWLKRVERTGFEQGLFSEWREDPGFVLNDPRFADARILVAGPNFGTGSSREHAVWAIQQYGFEAVISPRFGDIFRNNSTKNGLVPVQVSGEVARTLLDAVADDPSIEITVNVEQLTLSAPAAGVSAAFPLETSVQHRLLEGLDDIGLSLAHADAIDSFESTRPAWLPAMA